MWNMKQFLGKFSIEGWCPAKNKNQRKWLLKLPALILTKSQQILKSWAQYLAGTCHWWSICKIIKKFCDFWNKNAKIIQKQVKSDKWTLFKATLKVLKDCQAKGYTCRLLDLFLICVKVMFYNKDAVLWCTFHRKLYLIEEQISLYCPSNFEVLSEKGSTSRR